MVKRSIYVTLIMLVLYGILVSYGHIKPVIQYQSQNNVVTAQNYLYNDTARKSDVILGTSISAGIRTDILPKDVYLMALAGQSVYDGMDVIESAKTHPKYLFIEENSVLSAERKEFTTYLVNKPNYYRKKYIRFMRDDYQPAGQTYNVIALHAMGAIKRLTKYAVNPFVRIFYKGKETDIDKKEFYESAKRKNKPIDTALMNAVFSNLKKRVDQFKKNGTIVCFYSVPNDEVIYNSKISVAIRDYFREYFNENEYPKLPMADTHDYHTTDQIHLDSASNVKFSQVFARKIDSVREKYTRLHPGK